MKRGAKLGVLVAALLVLVGAWLVAENLSLSAAEQAQEAATAEPIDLSVGGEDQVSALSWNYFGDTVSLRRTEDGWENVDDPTCPIDPAAVEPLAEAVSELYAASVIEEVDDYDQYGLAEPNLVVMAAAGENIVTYEVGIPSANGTYYVRIQGQDQVYLADSMLYTRFSDSQIGDLLALESVPRDISAVTGLTVETEAGAYQLTCLGGGEYWYSDACPWYRTDTESFVPLDTDGVEELYELATEISLTDCAYWNVTDLAAYGLDKPQGAVWVDYVDDSGAEQQFGLEFGAYDGNGDVYVRLTGSKMVYRVSGLTLDGLMYPDFGAMAPMRPGALDWTKLESIDLELDGESVTVTRAVSTPTEEGEEPEDIYTTGGRSLNPEQVAQWLQRLYEMKAEGVGADPGRQSLFAFTFHQQSERWPQVRLEFRAYSSTHYLCLVNGETGYLVPRTTAEMLARYAREALAENIE